MRREEEKAAEMQEDKIIQGANMPPQTEQEFEKLGNMFSFKRRTGLSINYSAFNKCPISN